MARTLSVLVIEDSPNDAELMLRAIRRGGYDLVSQRVDDLQSLNEALQSRPWQIVVSDFAMPRFNGLEALQTVRETHRLDVPFIFVSGAIGEEMAISLMRAGAQDFVNKNNLSRLVPAIERELEAAETRGMKQQADAQLEFERRLLRYLMEGIPDAVYFKDRQHRYIQVNGAKRHFLHANTDDIIVGKTAADFLPPDAGRALWEDDERLLTTGDCQVDRVESSVQSDGTIRWLSVTKAPIRDHRGEIIGLVGIARDVTERKRQEQMKDEFVATTSHELRTPLTAMAASLGLLISSAKGDAISGSATRLLEIAHASCQRLVRLVNDILDIQKIEAGKAIFDLKPVEVRSLVEQTIESSRDFANECGVPVLLDSNSESAIVVADPDRLTQVISNLLSNAIKFSSAGAEVTVAIKSDDTIVRVSVRDHGPGIPAEYKDRLFQKFVRVDASDARQQGGSGLGLAIVKQIVNRLKGAVYFEAAPGGGTSFFVDLPRAAAAWEEGIVAKPVVSRTTDQAAR